MKKELNFYQRSVNISEKVIFEFYASLTDRYFSEIDDKFTTESTILNITFVNRDEFDVSTLKIQIPSATPIRWLSFKNWCKTKEIDVVVKKKNIERYTGISWPTIIEISTADDNEWLFLSKLEKE